MINKNKRVDFVEWLNCSYKPFIISGFGVFQAVTTFWRTHSFYSSFLGYWMGVVVGLLIVNGGDLGTYRNNETKLSSVIIAMIQPIIVAMMLIGWFWWQSLAGSGYD